MSYHVRMPYAVGGMYQILTQIKRFFRTASLKLGKWLKGRLSTIAFPETSHWHTARVTRFILLASPGINWPAMIALVPVTFRCLRYQDKAKKVLHLFCLFLDVIDAINSVYWHRCIWCPTYSWHRQSFAQYQGSKSKWALLSWKRGPPP